MLQVVSDIHLEFRTRPPIIPRHAPSLAILGDLGKPFTSAYRDFLEIASKQFEQVFLLMGNHEYYSASKTTDKILTKARQVCGEFPNVHLLERSCYDITPHTRLLGCTLWSQLSSDFNADNFNDFKKIKVKGSDGRMRRLDVHTYNAWHKRDALWIERELERCRIENKHAVVLTHHAIHPTKHEPGFTTALPNFIRPPVVAFASGHTHAAVDADYNNIRIVSNPLGYPDEDTGYSDACILLLTPN